MPWLPIGYRVVTPRSGEVAVGRFAGELLNGTLHLRISYRGAGPSDRFSFFIVDFVSDEDVRSVGSEKWWPRPEPSAVRLGPCPAGEVSGTVTIKARSFNRRRMLEGFPTPAAPLLMEAFLPAGVSYPRFTPGGFSRDGVSFDLDGDPVGPANAYPVTARNA
jgi:hypothetical protein